MADDANSLRSRTLSSFVWKFLERIGYQFIQMAVQIVLARLLTPEDFGVLAIMVVFVNVGNVIVQSGLNTALVQSRDATDDDFSTVFWMSLAISVIFYVAVFVSAPFVSDFYRMPELIWPLRVLCLVLMINALNACQVAHIQRDLAFRKIFNATIASVVVSGTAGIAAAFAGWGVWALVVQQLSYQMVNCVVLAAQVSWHPRLVFVRSRARELFSFGWKLLASGLLETLYQSLSDLIVGAQFTQADLGVFSQGKRYPQAVGTILDGAVQPVMLSAISRVQDDIDQVKRIMRRAIKTSTFVVVPVMACFAVVARPLVLLLLGEKWLASVPFLQMYCIVYAFLPIHSTNLQALNGTGHSGDFLRLEIIKKLYGGSFLLIAAFGFHNVHAIAIGSILGSVISTFVNAWPNTRIMHYSFGEQIRDYAPAFLLSLVAGLLAWPLQKLGLSEALTIVLQAGVMVVAYLGIAWIARVEEMRYLLTNARRILAGRFGA